MGVFGGGGGGGLGAGGGGGGPAGGDGTINEVINGFFEGGAAVRPGAVLGILPQGTASDFARSLDLPRDPLEALETALGPVGVTADVGWARLHDREGRDIERYYLNVAHFGLGGIITKEVRHGGKILWGFVPYLIGVLRSLWSFHKPTIRIEIEGQEPYERRMLNVSLANGRFCGGGLEISPKARLDDGLLEVSILGDLTRWEVLRGIGQLYFMHYTTVGKVTFRQAASLKAAANRRVYVTLDGEDVGELPIEVVALRGALPIAAPAGVCSTVAPVAAQAGRDRI